MYSYLLDSTKTKDPATLIIMGEVKLALQYSLTIPVMLHGSVKSFRVSLSEKNPK